QLVKGGPATDHQLPVGGVDHRQRPTPIREDVNAAMGQPKPPGLRVVIRWSEHRIVQERAKLLGRASGTGKLCFGNLPGILDRTHRCRPPVQHCKYRTHEQEAACERRQKSKSSIRSRNWTNGMSARW